MPTGPLPEPLLVVANNLFWAALQRYVPNLYRSYAQCLPLEPPLPLGVLWAQIGGGVLWPSLLPNPCIGTKDTACVDACPVDCIHPKKNTTYDDARPGLDEVPQLYIDPIECIDCGACVPVCPVSAIFALDDLPEKWKRYTELNASYVQGGKFTPEEYAKRNAAK